VLSVISKLLPAPNEIAHLAGPTTPGYSPAASGGFGLVDGEAGSFLAATSCTGGFNRPTPDLSNDFLATPTPEARSYWLETNPVPASPVMHLLPGTADLICKKDLGTMRFSWHDGAVA
jgi:hypothetical protein